MGREWRASIKLPAKSEGDFLQRFLKPWSTPLKQKSSFVYGSPIEERADFYVLPLSHKGDTRINYGLKFRDLRVEFDPKGRVNVIKSGILELKERRSATQDGVETWRKIIHENLSSYVVLCKEVKFSESKVGNKDATIEIKVSEKSIVKEVKERESDKEIKQEEQDNDEKSWGQKLKGFFGVCHSAKDKKINEDREETNGVESLVEGNRDKDGSDIEEKKLGDLQEDLGDSSKKRKSWFTFDGRKYEVCFDEIIKVLKKQIAKQKKAIGSEEFCTAIEKMNSGSEVGFVITCKHRYQSGAKEDTFLKNISFKVCGGVLSEERVNFYRSINIEESKEKGSVLENQLPIDFERSGMVVGGYPQLLWIDMEQNS